MFALLTVHTSWLSIQLPCQGKVAHFTNTNIRKHIDWLTFLQACYTQYDSMAICALVPLSSSQGARLAISFVQPIDIHPPISVLRY